MSSQEPTREDKVREYRRTRLQPDHPIHLIASITLLTAEEGGRINGVKTGYRGQFYPMAAIGMQSILSPQMKG